MERTRARTRDMLFPGKDPNFRRRTLSHVYLTRTLDAAIWAAELALGKAAERIYVVEPTGPIEGDPNVTDKKVRGNPTKSFRSRDPCTGPVKLRSRSNRTINITANPTADWIVRQVTEAFRWEKPRYLIRDRGSNLQHAPDKLAAK